LLSLRAKRGSPSLRTSTMDGHAALAMTHFLSLRAKRGSPAPRTSTMDGHAVLAMTEQWMAALRCVLTGVVSRSR